MTFKSHLSRSAFNLFQLLLLALIFSAQHASAHHHHEDNRPCYVCTYDARVYNYANAGPTAVNYCSNYASKGMIVNGVTKCDYIAFNTGEDDPNKKLSGKLTKCKFKCDGVPNSCGGINSRQRDDGIIDEPGAMPTHNTYKEGPKLMPSCDAWPYWS